MKRGEFEPRQHDMFSNDDNDYALQGHFDGFDVATMNTNRTGRAYVDSDDVTYVQFRTATPVAYISLRNYMAADNDYQVSAIRIDPTEQGKGLAPRFYHWLLTDGSISRLYADDDQTDGGAKIWERLLQVPNIAAFVAKKSEDEQISGRRVRTVRGLNKAWASDAYCLYAEATV